MTMTQPYQSDPYQRGSALSRSFLPLALITLGVVFLLGNVIPDRGRGGLIVLGLGAAFLVGRVTTGRYGYAVPAGILIAIGTYITLQEMQVFQAVGPIRGPGPFFVLLGLGFGLVYLIGSRSQAVWPLFPATILLALGLVVFGAGWLGPLSSLVWIVQYWPVVLVVIGAWLLFRDQLPDDARRPVATLGGLALLAYGLLAAGATVAAGGTFARTMAGPTLGAPWQSETLRLEAAIGPGQQFSVTNGSGRTVIRAGNGPNVVVEATRRFAFADHAPDVRLAPSSQGVSLESSNRGAPFFFGPSSTVDYTIDVPPSVTVKAQAGSGSLDIQGLNGAVTAEVGSGSIDLSNIAGEVRAIAGSGRINGTQLRRVREVKTGSGDISLDGVFTEAAQIRAGSGSINLRILPGSAASIDARTSSGRVVAENLQLSGSSAQRTSLTGTIGNPAPGAAVTIQASSGNVTITQ